MQYNEFVSCVRERSMLSEEQARRSTFAVFNTLGERLSKSLRDKLASEIPRELKTFLYGDWGEDSSRFDLEDFYVRVSSRADIGYPGAVEQTRCILSLLNESIPEGVMRDIFAELPDSFHELFGRKPQSPLSPTTTEKVCAGDEVDRK